MHDEHKRLTHDEVQRCIREGVKVVVIRIPECLSGMYPPTA